MKHIDLNTGKYTLQLKLRRELCTACLRRRCKSNCFEATLLSFIGYEIASRGTQFRSIDWIGDAKTKQKKQRQR